MVALPLIAGAIGVVVGRHQPAGRAASARVAGPVPDQIGAHDPTGPRVQAPIKRLDLTRKPTVAEIIPLLEHATKLGRWNSTSSGRSSSTQLESPDFPPLLAVLDRQGPSPTRSQLTNALYSRWAECDPAAALAHADASHTEAERQAAQAAVFQGWAYTDPQQLADWAMQLPTGSKRDLALTRRHGLSRGRRSGRGAGPGPAVRGWPVAVIST